MAQSSSYYSDFKVFCNPKNKIKSHTQENVGERFEMEDSTCSIPSFYSDSSNDFSFYAVFDGHNSNLISKHLANELLNTIIKADSDLFSQLARNPSLLTQQNELEKMKQAIRQGFLHIDRDMRALFEKENFNNNFGSTAVACLITSSHIFIANCGHSRALLIRDNQIVLSTKDHKPDEPTERDRVLMEGGLIKPIANDGPLYLEKIDGWPRLNMTRCLGDYLLKTNTSEKEQQKQLISPEPDIYDQERTDKDDLLLLATNSVFDLLSNEELNELFQKNRKLYRYGLDFITNMIMSKCGAAVNNSRQFILF